MQVRNVIAALTVTLVAFCVFEGNAIAAPETPPPRQSGSPRSAVAVKDSIETLCVEPARAPRPADSQGKPEPAAQMKAVTYEICDEWIRTHFPAKGVSDQLIALRESLDAQKDNASDAFRAAYKALQQYQLSIIVLGLLATILTALASRAKDDTKAAGAWTAPRNISFLAMIVTAVITAGTTIGEFYDFRGSVARNWTVRSGMAALHSEMDSHLMASVASGQIPSMKEKIAEWEQRRSKILQEAGDSWTSLIKGGTR